MGGCSGFLCQEFRELELLDYITKLCYTDKLNENVNGVNCNSLIQSFLKIHPAIKWNSNDDLSYNMHDIQLPSWHIIDKSQNKNLSNKSKSSNSSKQQSSHLKRKKDSQTI
jgi:hypothetical protein